MPHHYSANHESHQNQISIPNTIFAHCQQCAKFSIWAGTEMAYPIESDAPLPSEDMPDDIKQVYEEARLIAFQSPKGAAALLRLCVQMLCVHFGEKGENIYNDIGELVKKGLHPNIQKSLDIVRFTGNQAVHPGEIDFDDKPEKAMQLFGLVNLIVDSMITQPKKIAEIYGTIPEENRKQIQARDKKVASG